jgi:hypothetical protein
MCKVLVDEVTCSYPKNYCMTQLIIKVDGDYSIKKYCGDFAEMYGEWWLGTSDVEKCDFTGKTPVVSLLTNHISLKCTYACQGNLCNAGDIRPSASTLVKVKSTP